jgi:hypothetical protein
MTHRKDPMRANAMTKRTTALALVGLATLFFAACSSNGDPGGGDGTGGSEDTPASGGRGGSGSGGKSSGGGSGGTHADGGAGGTSPSAGGTAGGEGGQGAGSGGAAAVDAAPVVTPDAAMASPDAAPTAADAAPATGGKALMIVGAIPLIGDDITIRTALEKRGLEVVLVRETMAKPADTEGKAVVILSYTLDSDLFAAKNMFVDLPANYIFLERGILALFDMADKNMWAEPVTDITIVDAQSPLAAGLPAGDVTVYGMKGEVFWGMPGSGALKIASVKGNANQWVIFAYPKGAMMMTKKAAGKRLQFFLGAHLVPTKFLNDKGVQLLDAAIAWSIQ